MSPSNASPAAAPGPRDAAATTPAAEGARSSGRLVRDILHVDPDLCDGCGLCLPSCAEGALALVDGRVALTGEALCDGLGNCLAHCPRGALRVVRRESDPFDPVAAGVAEAAGAPSETRQRHARGHGGGRPGAAAADPSLGRTPGTVPTAATGQGARPDPAGTGRHDHGHEGGQGCGCPGAAAADLRLGRRASAQAARTDPAAPAAAEDRDDVRLSTWPLQLALVPPKAPFLDEEVLVWAADCAAVASPDFRRLFLGGPLLLGCPKLDDASLYETKLGVILASNPKIRELRLPIMSVPCCRGSWRIAAAALARSGRSDVRLAGWVFTPGGDLVESGSVPVAAGGGEA